MAQNLLDRLDESIGMEEHDLGRDISDAAMQRGISPVEMRGQLIQTMLQDDGKTISDKDRDLYAMGEISLAEAVKRSTVDRTLGTDVKALSERVQKGIAGLRPKMEDFSEYMFGVPSYIDAEAGMGRTLSDLDQVEALAADSGRTKSDQDIEFAKRLFVEEEEPYTIDTGFYGGRVMLDKDLEKAQSSQDFQQYLQDILNDPGATISDADRLLIQDLMVSFMNPNTLSDRDKQFLNDIKTGPLSDQYLGGGGRTPSDSDAAILEMLK
jgi:hypothetical protein